MKANLTAAAVILITAFAVPASVGADEIQEIVRSRIDTIHETGALSIGQEEIAGPKLLAALYEDWDFELIWTRPSMVQQLMTAIEKTPDHGLDPADYHYDAIRSRLDLAAKGLNGHRWQPFHPL